MKKLKLSVILFFLVLVNIIQGQNFKDNLANESIGDFPSNWDLLQGNAQVDDLLGTKIIRLGNKGTVAPLIKGSDYLSDHFTLEFEVYFDEVRQSINYQHYFLRLWPGTTSGLQTHDQGKYVFRPIKIHRHGMNTHYKDSGPEKGREYSNYITELKSKNPVWRKIKLDFDHGKLKIFMDGDLMLNIPNYLFNPSAISFEAGSVDGKGELTKAIKKISLENLGDEGDFEPNVVIIINPETDNIDDIEIYTKPEDTLIIKQKHKDKKCFVGRIDGDYKVKDKKIEPLENSTITIYTKNKTITNFRRAEGDLVVMPNYSKAQIEKNQDGKVILKVKKKKEKEDKSKR